MGMYIANGMLAEVNNEMTGMVPGLKKILLVDDMELFVQVEKEMLDKMDNFNVLVAHSAEEALQIVEQDCPDLVYMDLYMGGMDGDDCCLIIKEKYGRDIPVIMVTHGGSLNDYERCWKAGCDEILAKPINHHLFIATTKKYLDIHDHSDLRSAARLVVKHGTEQDVVLTNYSVNLSTGGLFLASVNILPVDTCFGIEFSIPTAPYPICCTARVAWVNNPDTVYKRGLPAGMGLQFIDISLDDVNQLRDYLRPGRLLPVW